MATVRSSSTIASRAAKSRGGVVIIEGLDQVVKSFTRETVTLMPRLAAATVKAAGRSAQRMRDRVPVDEGDLLDSISSDSKPHLDGARVYADAGPDLSQNPAAWRAHLIEHGTVKMAPQSFVAPAGDATLPEFVRDVKAASSL